MPTSQLQANSGQAAEFVSPTTISAQQVAREIKSLTSLRFFACCVMVYYHLRGCFVWLPDLASSFAFSHILTFFFVLSGFILTHNYFSLSGARSTFLFYLARVARLWPCHVLSLTLLVCLIPELFKVKMSSLPVYLPNLFMVHSWIPSWRTYFSYNAPSWTNSTEIFFYLCFPLLLWGFRKKWYVSVGITLLLSMGLAALSTALKLPELDTEKLCAHALTVVHPLARVFEFTIGMGTAILFRNFFSNLKLSTARATILELAAVGVLAWLNLSALGWREATTGWAGVAWANWLCYIAIPVLPVAALMTILATERGLLARLLGQPLLVMLGEISFATYMLHSVLVVNREMYCPQDQSLISCITFVAMLFVSAHFLCFRVERPFRKIILKWGSTLWPASKAPGVEPQIMKPVKAKSGTQGSSRKKLVFTLAEACLLIALIYFSLPAIHPVSEAQAATTIAQATVADVDFKPYLRCKAAQCHVSDGKVSVSLLWEALTDQTIDYYAAVNVYDNDKQLITRMTYLLSPRQEKVHAGSLWSDDFDIHTARSAKAASLGITVSRGKTHPILAVAEDGKPSVTMAVPITGPR